MTNYGLSTHSWWHPGASGCVALPLSLVEDSMSRGGVIWGTVSVEKAKTATNTFFEPAACTLLPAKAISGDHYHITTARQELILPSQCAYPPRPAVDAYNRVALRTKHKSVKERSTALSQASSNLRPACKLQPASCIVAALSSQQAMSAFSISLISALAEPHSLFPFSISWWGDPCLLGLHKAE